MRQNYHELDGLLNLLLH